MKGVYLAMQITMRHLVKQCIPNGYNIKSMVLDAMEKFYTDVYLENNSENPCNRCPCFFFVNQIPYGTDEYYRMDKMFYGKTSLKEENFLIFNIVRPEPLPFCTYCQAFMDICHGEWFRNKKTNRFHIDCPCHRYGMEAFEILGQKLNKEGVP